MVTYIKLQFNDNVNIDLSTSSFLYKHSTFLQAFDINEDTTLRSGASSAGNTIPILCPSSYVLDEYGQFLFNDKPDLSFIVVLRPSIFINVCKFLDMMCYENEDKIFSKQFIEYVMSSSYMQKHIHEIQYFMQLEIRSILNYINNIDIDIQIHTCTPEFYFFYLTRYKEEVIKYNRIDIFELSLNKSEYYRYIHKYDNHLTFFVKETKEYNDYITNISNQLLYECDINYLKKRSKKQYPLKHNNINKIKKLINYGANINLQTNNGGTALHYASCQPNNLEVIKYLVEHDANVNLQTNNGSTALHIASYQLNNLEVVKYLFEQGANINLQNNFGSTALHYASYHLNNLEVIKYLVEHNLSLNVQDNEGQSALMLASRILNNLETVKYLIKHGANIHLLNNNGEYVLHYASDIRNNIEIVKYLIECGVNVNLQDNDGNTALHNACVTLFNVNIIQYLIEHSANIHLQNNHGDTILSCVNHVIYSDDVDDYLRQFI